MNLPLNFTSNWSEPRPFRLLSEAAPSPIQKKESPTPLPPAPTKPALEPVKAPPKSQLAPTPKQPLLNDNLDAMLQSIDAELDLCSTTPAPLKIAVKAPDHPFYNRLKSAIAAHIGQIVDEGADLVLGCGGDIELLEPEAYTPEKKRALWDELKRRAQRQ